MNFNIKNLFHRMHISQLIKNSAKHNKLDNDDIQQCKLPELDVNNPEILKFIHDVTPIKCTPEDWVIADGSQLIIQEKAKKYHGQITCAFRGVVNYNIFFQLFIQLYSVYF